MMLTSEDKQHHPIIQEATVTTVSLFPYFKAYDRTKQLVIL